MSEQHGQYQLANAAAFAGNPQYAQQYAQQYAAVQQQQQAAHQQQQQAQASNMYATQLRSFWESQKQEVSQVGKDPAEFKNHQLPLARIKKIMKSDEDVRMISAEAPVMFAKACEMFILELTLRSWAHAEENRRRTLQRSDVATAVTKNDIFDFLADVVPLDEAAKAEAAAAAEAAATSNSAAAAAAAAAAVAGGPSAQAAAGMYGYPYAGLTAGADGVGAAGIVPGAGVMDPSLMYQQQAAGIVPVAGQQWPALGAGAAGQQADASDQ